jgi:hypothetical protein
LEKQDDTKENIVQEKGNPIHGMATTDTRLMEQTIWRQRGFSFDGFEGDAMQCDAIRAMRNNLISWEEGKSDTMP